MRRSVLDDNTWISTIITITITTRNSYCRCDSEYYPILSVRLSMLPLLLLVLEKTKQMHPLPDATARGKQSSDVATSTYGCARVSEGVRHCDTRLYSNRIPSFKKVCCWFANRLESPRLQVFSARESLLVPMRNIFKYVEGF